MPCPEHQWMPLTIHQSPVLLSFGPREAPLKTSTSLAKTSGNPSRRILTYRSCIKKIMETGEITENQMKQFTILEDKMDRVVQLPRKTLCQVNIPSSLCQQLLHHYHDEPLSGHLGRYKTYKRLQALAYWSKMSLDVKHYFHCCQTCQVQKPGNWRQPGKLDLFPIARLATCIHWFLSTTSQAGLSRFPYALLLLAWCPRCFTKKYLHGGACHTYSPTRALCSSLLS